MVWLKAIWEEVVGLFVDDLPFAAAILVWAFISAVVLPRLGFDGTWSALGFVVGLLAILAESVLRKAKSTLGTPQSR